MSQANWNGPSRPLPSSVSKPSPFQALCLRALGQGWEISWDSTKNGRDLYKDGYWEWHGEKGTWTRPPGNAGRGFVAGKTVNALLEGGWIVKTVGADHRGLVGPRYCISEQGSSWVLNATEDDFVRRPSPKSPLTAWNIRAALRRRYGVDTPGFGHGYKGWIVVEELASRTGNYSGMVDFWAMNVWGSGNYKTIAHEIKISRSDFFRDLKKRPTYSFKTGASFETKYDRQAGEEFYYVVPAGMVKPNEVPEDAGLMEVSISEKPKIRITKRCPPVPWTMSIAFMASLLRRVMRETQV